MESLIAKTKVEIAALRKPVLMWCCSSLSYRLQMESSSVSDDTVRKALMDSVANLALSANTALPFFSNSRSYFTRRKAVPRMMGIEVSTVTTVSFQPNTNEMIKQPTTLKKEMMTKTKNKPSSCWGGGGAGAGRAGGAPAGGAAAARRDAGGARRGG